MSELEINSSFGEYSVLVNNNIFADVDSQFFLVDSNIPRHLFSGILKSNSILNVEVKEEYKDLLIVDNLAAQLARSGLNRESHLYIVGGGHLQDIGTLLASIYMRGIDWSFAPSTLAAMGDSCIGGKSSINAGSVKNLLGNFYPPKKVLIDVSFCESLPRIHLISGIAEIVKICFAHSPEKFDKCTEILSDWELSHELSSLQDLVLLSLSSKKFFIEKDEFDLGLRQLLNFGHSFGHALESASYFKIPHGVAVLVGMLAACKHYLASNSERTQILQEICIKYIRSIYSEIETSIENLDFVKFADALKKDKKNSLNALTLVLPTQNTLAVRKIPYKDNAINSAVDALESALGAI